jgi:4-oxalocrotonate tautomerase
MPFVNIRLVKELIADAPAKKKADIGKRIADAICDVTGLPPQDVWIVFEEVDAKNWYIGPNDVEKLRFSK